MYFFVILFGFVDNAAAESHPGLAQRLAADYAAIAPSA
jgi:hypothetical protein